MAFPTNSVNNNQMDPLQEFIQKQKNHYIALRSAQASQEYDSIISNYVQLILNQGKQIKELQSKLPRKERVKTKNKGKK